MPNIFIIILVFIVGVFDRFSLVRCGLGREPNTRRKTVLCRSCLGCFHCDYSSPAQTLGQRSLCTSLLSRPDSLPLFLLPSCPKNRLSGFLSYINLFHRFFFYFRRKAIKSISHVYFLLAKITASCIFSA